MFLRNEKTKHVDEEKDTYYISFAVTLARHRFIIVTKKVRDDKQLEQALVIASFGFYYKNPEERSSTIPFWGALDVPGRIRSDHYYTDITDDIDDENRHVYVKNFQITKDQAIGLLNEVISDSELNEEKDKNKVNKPTKKIVIPPQFDEKEKELKSFFFLDLNKNIQGGPTYNEDTFNCTSYALLKLYKLGIRDPILEQKIPYGEETEFLQEHLEKATFKSNQWISKPTITQPKILVPTFPKSYHQMFSKEKTLVECALVLLHDYADNSYSNQLLHPKRKHREVLNKIIKYLEGNPKDFNSIRKIVIYIDQHMPRFYDIRGAFFRRIDFLRSKQEKSLASALEPKKSEFKLK